MHIDNIHSKEEIKEIKVSANPNTEWFTQLHQCVVWEA